MTLSEQEINALMRDLQLDADELQRRKQYLELTEHDVHRLVELHDAIHADGDCEFFVGLFYTHLLSFEETASLIPDEQKLNNLKSSQTRYFHSLTAGSYDLAYIKHRLRVGAAHERVGLSPKWYIGAYRKYLSMLIPKCMQVFNGDQEKTLATLQAILKIIYLDMGLAIDTYIYAKERTIRDKARQLEVLNNVAVNLNATFSIERIRELILQYAIELGACHAASVASFDDSSGEFQDIKSDGLTAESDIDAIYRAGGLAETTLDTGQARHARFDSSHSSDSLIHSCLCMPLISHGKRLGVVVFYCVGEKAFSDEEFGVLTTFSHLSAQAIANALLYAQVADEAVTDTLTGLPNRRSFDRRIKHEVRRSLRHEDHLALLIADIDHFKQINDTRGHSAGDIVLQELARYLQTQLRDIDFIARIGGEEFAIILPHTSAEKAISTARRLCESVSRHIIDPANLSINITISIGAACYPRCANDQHELIEHADQALYAAKHAGRNQVVLYHQMLKAEIEEKPDRIVELLTADLNNAEPIVEALSFKAPYFHDHIRQTRIMALSIGRSLGLSAEELNTLELAAQLHDLGVVYIPDSVFNKSQSQTHDEDWEAIRRHPSDGEKLLARVPGLEHIAKIVRHHHEHYDGSGYPDGLAGEAIPRFSRILAIADSYAAMKHDRQEDSQANDERIKQEFISQSGKQFDPELVPVILRLLEDNSFAAPGNSEK